MKKPHTHKSKGRSELKPDSYTVGYGKPPAKSRFQSGKSGNPKGRPTRPPIFAEIIATLMKGKITVTEGGIPKRMTSAEVLGRKLVNQALKGDKFSTALILELYNQHLNKTEVRVKSPQPINLSHLSPEVLDLLEKAVLLIENETIAAGEIAV